MISNLAYVYYYWSHSRKVGNDLANPIIPSIASLRTHFSGSIYVIDYSSSKWGEYPSSLNFKVFSRTPRFMASGYQQLSHFQRLGLARNIDIFELACEVPEQQIVACDSDLFWLNPVTNDLDVNFFNYRKGNIGCYYFDKSSPNVLNYIQQVIKLSYDCAAQVNLRKTLSLECNVSYFTDEIIFVYLSRKFPTLTKIDHFPYNGPFYDLLLQGDLLGYKNIHLLQFWIPIHLRRFRGLIGFLIDEVREHIYSNLSSTSYFRKILIRNSLPLNVLIKLGPDRLMELLEKTVDDNSRLLGEVPHL